MTVHIDPSAAVNGSGTEVSPYNVLPGTLTGNRYEFRRGTTYRPTGGGNAIFVGSAGNVTIGSYGSGDSPCLIDCSEANVGVRVGTNIANVTIEDDSIRIANVGSGSNRRGITNATTGSSGTTVTNITVGRIIIENVGSDGSTDCNGISLFGAGNSVRGTILRDIADDGIWFRGNLHVYGADIRRVAKSGRVAGDCIQGNSTVAGDCSGWRVVNSRLDHSDKPAKQCFIINASGGGGAGGLFLGNDVHGADDADHISVYLDWGAVICAGNVVRGGVVGISLVGNTNANSRVMGNLVLATYGRGIDASHDSALVLLNTVVGYGQTGAGIRHNDTSATNVEIEQNIVTGFLTGIQVATGATEDYNCIWGATTAVSGASLGANSFESDPLLDSSYRPTADSPCVGAGIFIPGAKHFGSVSMNPASPDIGAHRFFESRQTVSRDASAARALAAFRGQSLRRAVAG